MLDCGETRGMHAMGKRRKLLRWAVLAILLAGTGVPQIAAARAPAQEQEPEKLPAEEIRVLNRLRQLVSALEIYRSRYRGYPWELRQLGPPEEGEPSKDAATLIPVALTMGDAGEYLLEYAARDPSEDGATAFYLLAVPRQFKESPQRSFYVNQSGRIRYTLEKRKAKAGDPVFEHPAYSSPRQSDEETPGADEEKKDSPALERGELATLNRMKRIIQVLEIYRKRYGSYPQSLAHLGPPEDGPPTEKAARLVSRQLAAGSAQGYLFIYQAKPAPSATQIAQQSARQSEGYELKVRPQVYAGTGRVSFYADESGTIHATTENREPGPNDPTID